MLDPIAEALSAAVREPLELLASPDSRAYWPFLIAAVAIAAVALRSVRGALDPRVWLHRSARMDYRLVIAKAFVNALVLAPLALSALAIALWTVGRMTAWFGEPSPSSLSRWQVMAAYTVVLFVAWDLSRYVVHVLMHRVPWLWEFHKVHHSAEVLTPITVYRVHPVESFLYGARGALVTGVLTGVFFYAFQDKAVQYELLGVNAVGVAFNALGANLRHSHVWLSYGRAVERVLLSPAQHQLHHSADAAEGASNYGTFLAVWDRVGGSLLTAAGRGRPAQLGLPAGELNHDPASVTQALWGPVRACARRIPWRPNRKSARRSSGRSKRWTAEHLA